jgi:hypothetical protein
MRGSWSILKKRVQSSSLHSPRIMINIRYRNLLNGNGGSGNRKSRRTEAPLFPHPVLCGPHVQIHVDIIRSATLYVNNLGKLSPLLHISEYLKFRKS